MSFILINFWFENFVYTKRFVNIEIFEGKKFKSHFNSLKKLNFYVLIINIIKKSMYLTIFSFFNIIGNCGRYMKVMKCIKLN